MNPAAEALYDEAINLVEHAAVLLDDARAIYGAGADARTIAMPFCLAAVYEADTTAHILDGIAKTMQERRPLYGGN